MQHLCWALFTEVVHAVFVLDTVHRDGTCSVCAGHCSQRQCMQHAAHCSQRWCMQAEAWTPDAETHVQTILKKQETLYIYI